MIHSRPKVIALIPARGGSKGVPNKNIRPLGDFPLIAYSVVAAKACETIDRVLVSTDSPRIAEEAVRWGAEAPFLRPAELAGDRSPDRDFVVHALDWLRAHESYEPEILVHLRPTTPLRDPAEVDAAVRAVLANPSVSALRSAHPLAEPPQKMLGIGADGCFHGFFPDDPRPEYYNLPRQMFPPAYHPNGYVDVLRTAVVRGGELLHGSRILAYVTTNVGEIDTLDDLDFLEFLLARKGHPLVDRLRRAAEHLPA